MHAGAQLARSQQLSTRIATVLHKRINNAQASIRTVLGAKVPREGRHAVVVQGQFAPARRTQPRKKASS